MVFTSIIKAEYIRFLEYVAIVKLMFFETVEADGVKKPRFAYIGQNH